MEELEMEMRKFTEKDVIEMGVKLYKEHGFTPFQIRLWLKVLIENNLTEEMKFEPMFDKIIGLKF